MSSTGLIDAMLAAAAASQAQNTQRADTLLSPNVAVQQTSLTPDAEGKYQLWKSTLPPRLQFEGDYDLRGFFQKNPNFSVNTPGEHMTDEFKLPNHPTFSNESRYYNEKTQHLGGRWYGDVYIPNDPRFKQRVDESVPDTRP